MNLQRQGHVWLSERAAPSPAARLVPVWVGAVGSWDPPGHLRDVCWGLGRKMMALEGRLLSEPRYSLASSLVFLFPELFCSFEALGLSQMELILHHGMGLQGQQHLAGGGGAALSSGPGESSSSLPETSGAVLLSIQLRA